MHVYHLFDVHVGDVGEEVIADQKTEEHPVVYHLLQVKGEGQLGLVEIEGGRKKRGRERGGEGERGEERGREGRKERGEKNRRERENRGHIAYHTIFTLLTKQYW